MSSLSSFARSERKLDERTERALAYLASKDVEVPRHKPYDSWVVGPGGILSWDREDNSHGTAQVFSLDLSGDRSVHPAKHDGSRGPRVFISSWAMAESWAMSEDAWYLHAEGVNSFPATMHLRARVREIVGTPLPDWFEGEPSEGVTPSDVYRLLDLFLETIHQPPLILRPHP